MELGLHVYNIFSTKSLNLYIDPGPFSWSLLSISSELEFV